MHRREFAAQSLAGLGLAGATLGLASNAQAATRKGKALKAGTGSGFPKGFQWGVATAAHQIEGNNLNSDFWLLEHLKGTPFSEPSGDTCDSYHRYPEDIALVAKLGLQTYR